MDGYQVHDVDIVIGSMSVVSKNMILYNTVAWRMEVLTGSGGPGPRSGDAL